MEDTEQNVAPPPLDTLGDVRRMLSKTAHELRAGTLDPKTGGVLVNCLGVLAKVMQDQRDAKWTKRTREMWEAFQKQRQQLEAADAQH